MIRWFSLMFMLLFFGVESSASSERTFQEAVENYDAGEYEAAFQKFYPLAEDQYVSAKFNVATMYYFGQGVEQDYEASKDWYYRAARRGHRLAQDRLAYQLFMGYGADEDLLSAYVWSRISALNGSPTGEALSRMLESAFLTREQMEEGFKVAERCVEYNYELCGPSFEYSADRVTREDGKWIDDIVRRDSRASLSGLDPQQEEEVRSIRVEQGLDVMESLIQAPDGESEPPEVVHGVLVGLLVEKREFFSEVGDIQAEAWDSGSTSRIVFAVRKEIDLLDRSIASVLTFFEPNSEEIRNVSSELANDLDRFAGRLFRAEHSVFDPIGREDLISKELIRKRVREDLLVRKVKTLYDYLDREEAGLETSEGEREWPSTSGEWKEAWNRGDVRE